MDETIAAVTLRNIVDMYLRAARKLDGDMSLTARLMTELASATLTNLGE